MLGMETITNKEVNVRLDNEKGTLCLTGLLAGTMVFLYDSQGELKGKHKFALPLLTMEIPQQGTYVLVMSHPNCQPEVRNSQSLEQHHPTSASIPHLQIQMP